MKLKTLLNGFQKAQAVLLMLESAGIDVDRLIGISNAQGPQGKVLKDAMAEAMSIPDSHLVVPEKVRSKNKSPRTKALKP